jgi:hypothetical protein
MTRLMLSGGRNNVVDGVVQSESLYFMNNLI